MSEHLGFIFPVLLKFVVDIYIFVSFVSGKYEDSRTDCSNRGEIIITVIINYYLKLVHDYILHHFSYGSILFSNVQLDNDSLLLHQHQFQFLSSDDVFPESSSQLLVKYLIIIKYKS